MANEGAAYVREVWDSLIHYKSNKKKKNAAIEDIDDFLENYPQTKLPEKTELPDAPTYEHMEYNAPDDAKLRENAEEELAAFKAQGEQGVQKEIDALSEKYAAQAEKAKEDNEAAENKTKENYAAARENVNNDMLKRGLARSSIAANKQSALSESEAEALSSLAAAYAKEVGELGEKINGLDAQRQAALNDFNLSYAAKLSERINELKAERDKKMSEVLKYNNSLTEKEHAAQVDKTMKESDLYSEALSQKQKENELKKTNESDYATVYAAIAEKLRSINKNDARDIVLNNPNVRGSLNSAYYYKLYDEFCR